ncbi:DUF3560 domain-containing protein [Pseudonocardia spinosispora]|uniref:DUF3560 domain-containing protein n=1 Tax=Pseudonocardia spinosispora TaxID=103441 RepID=UPI00041D2381|nr:DUF3560 domain-containing protein [Pseudonocardia spinosispora]
MTRTITHSAAEGTMLEGSTKGDGAWDAIKAAQSIYRIRGWRYMPRLRALAVAHSRDRAPDLYLIETTAAVLCEAGFEVEVRVDATPRAMDEAEVDRAGRMDERVEVLSERAERRKVEVDAWWGAADAISEYIPRGQPILVWHHFERGHRRVLARMDGHMHKAVELGREAERAADGAASAAGHMDRRESLGRVARRLERLETERGKVSRNLDGCASTDAGGRYRAQQEATAADLDEKIRYWRRLLEEHRAAGRYNPYDATTIKVGDFVGSWAGWREVVRVNKTTVTIRDNYGNSNVPEDHPGQWFTRRIKYGEIISHRPAHPPAVDLDEVAAQ